MTNARDINRKLVYRMRMRRTASGYSLTIPVDALRTLGWQYGHLINLAVIDVRERFGNGVQRALVVTRNEELPVPDRKARSADVVYRRVYTMQLRRTNAGHEITVPKDAVSSLRWEEGDSMAVVLLDDGLVVSRIEQPGEMLSGSNRSRRMHDDYEDDEDEGDDE